MNENKDNKNKNQEDTGSPQIEKDEKKEDKKEISELDKIKSERDEYLAGWQRAKADFSNAKKRLDEEMVSFRKYANEGLLIDILPVLQSFEMAFANKEAWEKADKNWRSGVEYIYNQLKGVLESNGLVEINPLGVNFDHSKHEAVEYQKTEDSSNSGKVIKVLEKGYVLGDKLIKPAKVVVGE